MWQQLQKKYLGSTIPLINVHGIINAQTAQRVSKRLSSINPTRAAALAVSVNSPGGYPVQSLLISNKIQYFAQKHNLKVLTFATHMAASGGYFVLCTGNHVFADRSSIVGSIGVIFPKWNLGGLLDMASLQNKNLSSSKDSLHDIFNPFNAATQQQKQQVRQTCSWTHQQFINHVKKYRSNKLKIDDQIFSGEVFNGQEAKEKGLVDQVGSMVEILQKYYPGSHLDIGRPKNSFAQIFAL